jgi:hypothetical protein
MKDSVEGETDTDMGVGLGPAVTVNVTGTTIGVPPVGAIVIDAL